MQQKYYWQHRDHQSGPERKAARAAELIQALTHVANGSGLVAQMLANRGISTIEQAQRFLHPTDINPSSAHDLPNLEQGLARVAYAVQHQEPILIYGDFDVDGVTGTSILYDTLKNHLKANVSFYIPHRAHEGHGLNTAALLKLVSARQVKVVITTDTGISNFSEVSLLNSFKVDTIITDHHELPEHLPPALANINPKLLDNPKHPLYQLSGAGVAFLFCKALLEEIQPDGLDLPATIDHLSALAAIGLVADVVPLIDDNRYWVTTGLSILNRRQHIGLEALLAAAGVPPDAPLNSQSIGFVIGPRINAIGRLDHAAEAVELLTTQNADRAATIAARLEQLNRRRQGLCDQTFAEAEKYLRQTGGLDGRRAIILGSPDWNPGIIGIVASRLVEKYRVPALLMHIDTDKNEARGSARSIPGFALHEAIESVRHLITHGGGHSAAAGFGLSLDKLNAFKAALYQYAADRITDAQMIPSLTVEATLDWSQVNTGLVDLIGQLEPYGAGNPSPLFEVGPVMVGAQRTMGSEQQHKKLVLTPDGHTQPVDAIIWNADPNQLFTPNTPYHLVVEPQRNTFNGKTSVQLMVRDAALATAINQHLSVPVLAPTEPVVNAASSPPPSPAPTHPILTEPRHAPTLAATASSHATDPVWVDHRQRPSLEDFIQQFLVPLSQQASDGPDAPQAFVIYHEGSKPQLPLVQAQQFITRHQANPAHELLFWDIPPDLATLQAVLQQTQPAVVHWLGGKYQQVATLPATDSFLKGMAQVLTRRLGMADDTRSAKPILTPLRNLVTYFATTESALISGLALLQQAQTIRVELTPDHQAHITLHEAITSANAAWDGSIALTGLDNTLEYRALSAALQSVGTFRQQMLSWPLDKIQSAANAIPTAPPTMPTVAMT